MQSLMDLRDRHGRRVEIATYGQAQGRPVFFLHGTPGSGVGLDLFDRPAVERGVSIFAPHRPGVGRSDGPPVPSLLDYADDVAGLADTLGLDRFGVIGYSSGGPFALACGARLGNRLTSVATIGGVAPLEDDEVRANVHAQEDRILRSLEKGDPRAAARRLRLMRFATRSFPRLAHAALRREVDASDQRALDAMAGSADNQAPAFEQGTAAAVNDYRIWASPWGFDLADIGVDVHIWHGAHDRLVPSVHARALRRRLPAATLHLLDETGHISILLCLDEILDRMFSHHR